MRRFIILLLLLLSLAACKTVGEYERVASTDTIYVSKVEVRVDSVWIDRYRNVYLKGDTVFEEIWRTEFRYVYRDKTDTIYETKVEEREVERVQTEYKRSGYDRFVSWGFWIVVVLVVAVVVWWIIKDKIFVNKS